MQRVSLLTTALIVLIFSLIVNTSAQTTAFNYQGSLNSTGTPANGNHDFEFALFDSLSGGTQLGSTLTRGNVAVSNGVFSVSLDFANQFPGANRFLEIRVRATGQPSFTVLSPRQQIISSPYSLRTLVAANAGTATTATNATLLGGVSADQYVLTGDSRLSNARNPLPGSPSYIQNQNAGIQPLSNFSISGDGTVRGTMSAGIVNAGTQFNIGGVKMFSGSGAFNDSDYGIDVTFANTFVGEKAGMSTTPSTTLISSVGKGNTFVGADAGKANTTGHSNSFFGLQAGAGNTTGSFNTYYGDRAGAQTDTGGDNVFVGRFAAFRNKSGSSNAFFGTDAGLTNSIGSNNTLIGTATDTSVNNLTFATAIGAGAVVATSSTVVLGRASDAVQIPGTLRLATLGAAGPTTLCRNAANLVATCSSSGRYKSNINRFSSGLRLIKRLQPVSFNWRDGGILDLGLVAEEVAKVEPLLTTTNDKGEIEGVKYDRIAVVLVNAAKEQQAEIESLRKANAEQDARLRKQAADLDALKKLVCAGNSHADICRQQPE